MSIECVFLHGFLGRPSMWDATRALLPFSWRTTAIALPGHGPSPVLCSEMFDDAVDQIGNRIPRHAWLVGYSMGARVALALALSKPGRWRGAVLIGVDPGLRDAHERATRIAWEEQLASRVTTIGVERFADEWAALPIFATQADVSSEARARQRAERSEHTSAGIAWALRTLGLGRMPSYWSDLPRASLPITVVTGGLDAKFTALGASIARTAPSAKHHVIVGAGHNVAFEAPAALAALLEREISNESVLRKEQVDE